MIKAQAAMEFLMTYGWVIIALLVTIGALAYFGILTPGRLSTNSCTLFPGLACIDTRIIESNIIMSLRNGIGYELKQVSIKIDDCNSNAFTLPIDIPDGETFMFNIPNCAFTSGTKINKDVEVSYIEKSLGHTRAGKITGIVENSPISSVYDLNPIADAYVLSSFPNNNYGQVFIIQTSTIAKSYLKFDTSICSGPIVSAQLYIYVTSGCIYTGSNSCILINNVKDTSWIEGNGGSDDNPPGELKWNNRPGLKNVMISQDNAVVGLNTFDVTPYIASGGLYTIGLSTDSTDNTFFSSKESSSNKPVLQVIC